jgi:hypothetical protein
MSDIATHISDTMLVKLAQRDPSMGPDDLSRPVTDLDYLDMVELHPQQERELQVEGDLRETAGFGFLDEFGTYFLKLASRG